MLTLLRQTGNRRGSRQDEIFTVLVALVHENCISQREVNFYANELCIFDQISDSGIAAV